ncbi:MAG: hypothetical protein ABI870_03205, partial [Rhodanobacter sp.]
SRDAGCNGISTASRLMDETPLVADALTMLIDLLTPGVALRHPLLFVGRDDVADSCVCASQRITRIAL